MKPSTYRSLNTFSLKPSNPDDLKGLFRNAFAQVGLSETDIPDSFEAVVLNDFTLDISSKKHDAFNFVSGTLGTLNRVAQMVGGDALLDIPQRYIYKGSEPLSWNIQSVISIYDGLSTDIENDNTDVKTIDDACKKSYQRRLAYLLALLLPYQDGSTASLSKLYKDLKERIQSILPDSVEQSSDANKSVDWVNKLSSVSGLADDAVNTLDRYIQKSASESTKGTLLEGLYGEVKTLDAPIQYSIVNQIAKQGSGLIFEYGPNKICNVLIEKLNVTFSKMVFKSEKNRVGIPEYIKLNFTFSCQYNPSLNTFTDLIQRLG